MPCCDDERCVFVETARTSIASSDCAEGVMCMACVDLGYFLDRARLTSLLDLFILKLQQNIPSLFSRSSQHVRESLRGVSCCNSAVQNYFTSGHRAENAEH
jgi:hypothetical protein